MLGATVPPAAARHGRAMAGQLTTPGEPPRQSAGPAALFFLHDLAPFRPSTLWRPPITSGNLGGVRQRLPVPLGGAAMHLVTRIDIDRCLAVLTVTGPYDPGATFAALRGLSADQRFGRDWGLLVDARGAGEPPAYPELQRLADAAADPKL